MDFPNPIICICSQVIYPHLSESVVFFTAHQSEFICPTHFHSALLRDVPGDHFGCFFEHCSKGGGDQTHVQKFCCRFCIIMDAIWQYNPQYNPQHKCSKRGGEGGVKGRLNNVQKNIQIGTQGRPLSRLRWRPNWKKSAKWTIFVEQILGLHHHNIKEL